MNHNQRDVEWMHPQNWDLTSLELREAKGTREIGSMIMVWTGCWTASKMHKGVQRCKDVQSTKGSPGASIFRVSWSTMQKRNFASLVRDVVRTVGAIWTWNICGLLSFPLMKPRKLMEIRCPCGVFWQVMCAARVLLEAGREFFQPWIALNVFEWRTVELAGKQNSRFKQVRKRTRRYKTSKTNPID